ncbi:NADPH:quinone oxidoreductase family protein [Sphingobium subterraneum]|uniref:NADPH:quinone reductase-like Zn-dependent oxidoreductase n=1 Tax=Sphingobium subterraneum TaxID=627688 RepID=A0A841J2U3_9SPHN|nr:NADPH:quinone oxidoreductase family protein [Sphingobium subterraneum]MBB6125283.1 NADPH:quinone reductase-like Zn-dependent oxidoreductase [Sphingobium subterraneum]
MKALLSVRPGGPDTLQLSDIEMPRPAPGELCVRVLACGINYPDVLIIEDKYQFKPPRPFAPGSEITGEVEEVGEGAGDWRPGDRLIALLRDGGGLAEQAVVKANTAIRLPEGFDPVEGAALMLTYATTIHALVDRGRLQPGQTLLVLGAAGGVGLAAVEIGKAMGAKVIAAVSDNAKAAAAGDAGADHVMIYSRGPFDKDGQRALAASFKEAVGPEGAHVIYDPVGGDYSEAALRAIAWEGRHLVVGFPAGIPRLPLNIPLLKSCDVCGVFWGAFMERDPEGHLRHVAQLLDWWAQGRIRPRVDTVYALAEGGQAIAQLAARSAIGKLVVCP